MAAGFLTSFLSTLKLVGIKWFGFGRYRAIRQSPGVITAASRISFIKSSGILSYLYSVPYYFSFLSQLPGNSYDIIVILKLLGRRRLIALRIRSGSNFHSLLYPLRSNSRGIGFYIIELILLVKLLV